MKKVLLTGVALAALSASAIAQTVAPTGVEDQVNSALTTAWRFAVAYVPTLVAGAAWIAPIIPPASSGTVWAVIRGVIDFIAGNWGNAANAK